MIASTGSSSSRFLEWIKLVRFPSMSSLFVGYQFGLRVFGDELEQAAVGWPIGRIIDPCVEELGDVLERSPSRKIGVGHPLPVHGSVEGDGQD